MDFAPLLLMWPAPAAQPVADDALNDTFTLQGLRARQPRRSDGGYDWRWTGPQNDPEWAWFFNRHGWFSELWRAWQETRDPRYRDALFATLDDWISSNPPPGRFTFSASWRPLEAARRLLGSWLPLRQSMLNDPALSPALRNRFQASLEDHGGHLRRHHALGGNHLVTEMLALVRLAFALPDCRFAGGWLAYGLDHLDRTYREQIYPDGAHKELSSHYHRIVTLNYQQLLDTLRAARCDELAATWEPRVERLWFYVREVATPAGLNPLNNDSDQGPFAQLLRKHAPALAEHAPRHPMHFPWAGQTVFRDETNHQWGFFDAGPRGTDHDHADRLAFTCSLGSCDFLVDNGRFTYAPGPWRDYFAGPAAHNLLLLDNQASGQGPRAVAAAFRPIAFQRDGAQALAWGDSVFTLDGNPRAADWRRVIAHLHGPGWIVMDHLVTFGPRRLSTLWHWHPGCLLPAAPDIANDLDLIVQHTGGIRLRVRLVTTAPGGASELMSGRTRPTPQGWFSDRFNHREPAPVLVHHQRIAGPVTNIWLFRPEDAPEIRVTISPNHCLHVLVEGTHSSVLDPQHPERWAPPSPAHA